jgi:hypothetical protein
LFYAGRLDKEEERGGVEVENEESREEIEDVM